MCQNKIDTSYSLFSIKIKLKYFVRKIEKIIFCDLLKNISTLEIMEIYLTTNKCVYIENSK